MIARHVRVTGRVQGVFFRAWAREQAGQFGVSGWIRNCPDGSVEAHVEGDEAAVSQLLARLHSGPSGAQVSDLEVENAEAQNLSGFEVRH
jgi:acylphosphatase